MKSIIIPIHSVIDVITNSSTELYVEATEQTVTAAKSVLAAILKATGSTQMVDELFDVSLAYWVRYPVGDNYDREEKEFPDRAAASRFFDKNNIEIDDEYTKKWNVLKITAKKGTDASLKKIAKLLEEFGVSTSAEQCEQ